MPSNLFQGILVNDIPNSAATIDQANTTENIAASISGHIHVAYGGSQVRVATSLNRGQSFLPSVLVADTAASYVAVDTQGANNVYVAWSPGWSTAFVSMSSDGGATFSAPQTVTTSGSFSGINLAVHGPDVYVESSGGGPVYHNATGGIGAYTSADVNYRAYRKLEVDPNSGDVYSIGDTPILWISKSTDQGASFSPDTTLTGTPPVVYYSTTASSFGLAGSFAFVAGNNGNGNVAAKIDLSNNSATTISGLGNDTDYEGRSLAADAAGNLVDAYYDSGTIKYQVSQDLGSSFAAPVSVASASTANVAINPAYQDVLIVYQVGNDLFLNVYQNELKTNNLPPVAHDDSYSLREDDVLVVSGGDSPTVSLGAGSAVSSVDRVATFDGVVTGTNLDGYTEGGLRVSVPKEAYNGGLQAPTFSGGFHYPSGGVYAFTRISASDAAKLYGLEFNVADGWGPSHDPINLHWEMVRDGSVIGSGVFTAPRGEVVGFSNPGGFDELRVGAYSTFAEAQAATSSSFQALALDNLTADLTPRGILGNDTDPNGDPLQAILGTGPAHGDLTLNPNGGFTYTPDAHYSGSDSFTYQASDGVALSNVAIVTLNVQAVADAPTLSVADVTGDEGSPTPLSIAAGLVDTDGSESLTIRLDGVPANAVPSAGTANPDGSWSLAPADLTGLAITCPDEASFVVTVTATTTEASNHDTASTVGAFQVTINNVAPVLSDVAVTTPINENETATLTGTFTDPGLLDSHTLTVSWGDPNNPAVSTFALDATASLKPEPAPPAPAADPISSSTDDAVLTITAVDTTTGAVSFSVQHQYADDGQAPGNGTPSDVSTITVLVSDEGGSDSALASVTVNNVAPSFPLPPSPVSDLAARGMSLAGAPVAYKGEVYYQGIRYSNADPLNMRVETELFKIDAATGASVQLTHFGEQTFFGPSGAMAVSGGWLYFVGNDGTGAELWRTDGVPGHEQMVADLAPGAAGSYPDRFLDLGGTLYFAARPGTATELYRTNGTSAGTVQVSDLAAHALSLAGLPVAYNGEVYYQGIRSSLVPPTMRSEIELFKIDAATGAPVQLTHFGEQAGLSSGNAMAVSGGWLYFVGNDGTGAELWRTDGVPGHEQMVADLAPGAAGSSPNRFLDLGGTLYFAASNGSGTPAELYRTNGTPAGTVQVSDLAAQGLFLAGPPVAYNGEVYYQGFSAMGPLTMTSRTELFKIDATTGVAVQLTHFGEQAGFSNPDNAMAVSGGWLYFVGNDGTGVELWRTDGVPGHEQQVADLAPGADGSSPGRFLDAGGLLYFAASTGAGTELYRTDGTPAGSALQLDRTSVDENGVVTLTGTFTDPGMLDTFTLNINWGDGSETIDLTNPPAHVTFDVATRRFTVTHRYADDDASLVGSRTYPIQVTVTDDDGGSGSASTYVTVLNVAPAVALNPVAAINENETATLTGTFTDPGLLDSHTLTITWGDPNKPAISTFALGATASLNEAPAPPAPAPPKDEPPAPAAPAPAADAPPAAEPAAAESPAPAVATISSSTDDAVLTITTVDTTTGAVSFSVQHRYADDGQAPGNGTPSDFSIITVLVSDDDGGSGSAPTTVMVNNVAPTAVPHSISVDEDGPAVSLNVLEGATDPGPLDVLTAVAGNYTSAAGAKVTITADGTATYDPSGRFDWLGAGQTATDSFTYQVADDDGGSSTATVTVTVTGQNDAPVAVDDTAAVDEDTRRDIAVLANDHDIDSGDRLTVTFNPASPMGAALSLNGDGTLRYDPTVSAALQGLSAGESMTDTFGYTITDSHGASASAKVTVHVTGVNDAPTLTVANSNVTVNEGQMAQNPGTFADIDLHDSVSLRASVGDVVPGLNGTWSWSWTAADGPDQSGLVTITADDGHGGIATRKFSLAVNDVAPTLVLTGADHLPQRSTYTLTLGSVIDPGRDTVSKYLVHWGDGCTKVYDSTHPLPTDRKVTHVYSTPGTYPISIDLVDEDGPHGNVAGKIVEVTSPSRLAFTSQPRDSVAGVALPNVVVEVQDRYGERIPGDTRLVTISVASGPIASGRVATATAVDGKATFSDLKLTTAGAYTLKASNGVLADATSAAFTISPAAAGFRFVQQPPTSVLAGALLPPVTVQLIDKFGNAVAQGNVAVTLRLSSYGDLRGTLTVRTDSSGRATFSNLRVYRTGTYQLIASSGKLTEQKSIPIQVRSSLSLLWSLWRP